MLLATALLSGESLADDWDYGSVHDFCVDLNYGASGTGDWDNCDFPASHCGLCDDDDFTSNEMCCVCGGGEHFSTCENTDTTYVHPDGTIGSDGDIDPWYDCLLYTSPSPRDGLLSRMPSSA